MRKKWGNKSDWSCGKKKDTMNHELEEGKEGGLNIQ